MDIAHDEVCSECHPRYPTSQFQHLALEEECFSTVETVWATANLASCPQCMLCGSQRKALQSKAQCSSSWTRMFFYQLSHQSLWLGQELQHHCRPSTEEYRPWHHLCPTNLKPDLVIWNDAQRAVCLIELTFPLSRFCWCSNGRNASTARSDGVQCTVSPIPVGQWQFHELAPLSRCVQACYSRSVLWSVGHSPMRILFCIYVCGVPVTAPVIARV